MMMKHLTSIGLVVQRLVQQLVRRLVQWLGMRHMMCIASLCAVTVIDVL